MNRYNSTGYPFEAIPRIREIAVDYFGRLTCRKKYKRFSRPPKQIHVETTATCTRHACGNERGGICPGSACGDLLQPLSDGNCWHAEFHGNLPNR